MSSLRSLWTVPRLPGAAAAGELHVPADHPTLHAGLARIR